MTDIRDKIDIYDFLMCKFSHIKDFYHSYFTKRHIITKVGRHNLAKV